MVTKSKKENSANEDQPKKACEACGGSGWLDWQHPKVIKRLAEETGPIPEMYPCPDCQSEESELLAIIQEADKALLAKKPVVAHSAMRLAITELSETE